MSVVKGLFERNCPNILEVILQDTDFNEIDKRFDLYMNSLNKLIESGDNEILVNTTFIDLLLRNEEGGNIFIKDFIRYCDELVKNTVAKIESKHNKGIRRAFVGKITNLESWNYLNPIGEIAALNKLISYPQLILLQIEYKMPNRKKADFLLRNIENGNEMLVEVVNIHPNDGQDEKVLQSLILKKLIKKVHSERISIPYLPQVFLPIIWAFDYNIYIPLEEFLLDFKSCNGEKYIPGANILGYCGFVQYTNTVTHERQIIFGFIDEIIKDYRK